eukprot:320379-Rhodomonas_salina.2
MHSATISAPFVLATRSLRLDFAAESGFALNCEKSGAAGGWRCARWVGDGERRAARAGRILRCHTGAGPGV